MDNVIFEGIFLSKNKIIISVLLISSIFAAFFIASSPYRMDRVKLYFNAFFIKKHHIDIFKQNSPQIPLRAQILSENNTTLATTKKMYKLSLLNGAFDKETFTKLISALSQIIPISPYVKHYYLDEYPYSQIHHKIIAYGIDKEKKSKIEAILNKFIKNRKDKTYNTYYYFQLSGEKRVYPYNDFFEPYLGYTIKSMKNNDTYRKGLGGLEKYYDKQLTAFSLKKKPLHLYIDLKLQKDLESKLDTLKKQKNLKEAVAVIINPDNGHIVAIASSNRYNPNKISKNDYIKMNISAIRYLIDANNLLKPINKALICQKQSDIKKGYKEFGVYEKSGIDLPYEKIYKNKNKDDIRLNFMQILKAYLPFYNKGKIVNPNIAMQNSHVKYKQIISQSCTNTIHKDLKAFFTNIKTKKFSAISDEYNTTVSLDMQEISIKNKKYLQAYLFVNKNFKDRLKTSEHIYTNKLTGLVWQENRSKKKYTWKEAKKYCSDLVYGGYNDWRLPSQQEYKDIFLMYSKKRNTSDDNRNSTKTVNLKIEWHSPWFWTSTKYNTTQAWIFNAFIDKDRHSDLKKEYLIRCVRE